MVKAKTRRLCLILVTAAVAIGLVIALRPEARALALRSISRAAPVGGRVWVVEGFRDLGDLGVEGLAEALEDPSLVVRDEALALAYEGRVTLLSPVLLQIATASEEAGEREGFRLRARGVLLSFLRQEATRRGALKALDRRYRDAELRPLLKKIGER